MLSVDPQMCIGFDFLASFICSSFPYWGLMTQHRMSPIVRSKLSVALGSLAIRSVVLVSSTSFEVKRMSATWHGEALSL